MKSNTQNKKIEAITETTLVIGIDVGSETHYARAFDYRGIEFSKKPFKSSNSEAGFEMFKAYLPDGIYADLRTASNMRFQIQSELTRVQNRISRWFNIYFPEYKQCMENQMR